MATSSRQRASMEAKAQTLIPEAHVVTYVVGRSGANPLLVGWGMAGGFLAFSLALFAATRVFLFPGVIPFLGLQFFLSPPRGVAVCDRGLALTGRSFWNGKPTEVLALFGFEMYRPVEVTSGRTHLRLGTEDLWLVSKEMKELHRGLTTLSTVQSAHAPVPPAGTAAPAPAPAAAPASAPPPAETPATPPPPPPPTTTAPGYPPYGSPPAPAGFAAPAVGPGVEPWAPASDPWAADPYRSGGMPGGWDDGRSSSSESSG